MRITPQEHGPQDPGQAMPAYMKASLVGRVKAGLVDWGILFLASIVAVLIGGLFVLVNRDLGLLVSMLPTVWAVYYLLVKDGRPGGQSIGKKFGAIMVISVTHNRPCTKMESLMRNAIFILPGFIPRIGSWLVWVFIGLELVLLLVNPQGRRIGDYIAKTQVINVADYHGAEES